MWAKRLDLFKDPAQSINESGTCSALNRRRDFIELAGIYSLILVMIWTPRPWQWGLWILTAVCVSGVIAISFDGWRTMGICTDNLCRSLWAVALAIVLAIISVGVAGRLHTLQLPRTPELFIRHYGLYAVWATVQQLILQCFFLSRAIRLIPNATAAAALSAVLFAAAHLPNPLLTLITLVFGLASCLFFLHYRNLFPLAVAHAILGTAIAVTIPQEIDHNMRVGLGYLTWVNQPIVSETVMLPNP
jgi:membrane protease YdiL (CAAX protease family)